jgi:hypothetical protein
MSLLDRHYCPITVKPSREVVASGRSALDVVSARVLEFAVFESVSTCDCNAYFCCCSDYYSRCHYLSASISCYRTERSGCSDDDDEDDNNDDDNDDDDLNILED